MSSMGGGEIAAIKVCTLEVTITLDGGAVAWGPAVGAPPPDPPDAGGIAVAGAGVDVLELPQATATTMTMAINAKTTIGRLGKWYFFISFVLLACVAGSID
jgi:hypothetical protein